MKQAVFVPCMQAELNVYEEFATIHCAGRIDPPAVCAEAEEAVMDLKHSLQLLAKSTGHNMKLNPEHHWDIFGIETDDTEVGILWFVRALSWCA